MDNAKSQQHEIAVFNIFRKLMAVSNRPLLQKEAEIAAAPETSEAAAPMDLYIRSIDEIVQDRKISRKEETDEPALSDDTIADLANLKHRVSTQGLPFDFQYIRGNPREEVPVEMGEPYEVGPLVLHPGLYVVMGSSGSGKTVFMRGLVDKLNVPLLRVSEPPDYKNGTIIPELIRYPHMDSLDVKGMAQRGSTVRFSDFYDLARVVTSQTVQGSISVVDSVQALLRTAQAGEGVMSGAVAPSFFQMTSAMSTIAQIHGSLIVLSINPLLKSESGTGSAQAQLDALIEALKGSASGFIYKPTREGVNAFLRHANKRELITFSMDEHGELSASQAVNSAPYGPTSRLEMEESSGPLYPEELWKIQHEDSNTTN